jgi:hypothetical protein
MKVKSSSPGSRALVQTSWFEAFQASNACTNRFVSRYSNLPAVDAEHLFGLDIHAVFLSCYIRQVGIPLPNYSQ